MNNYKYLLFDADNTLFDFNKAERAAFLSLSRVSPDVFKDEHYESYHKINDSMWKSLERGEITKSHLKTLRFQKLYESFGHSADPEFVSHTAKEYESALGNGRFLIDGATEILEYLFPNYKIHIITNGLKEVQTNRFVGSGIEKYISTLFISEEIGYEKPDERFFNTVFDSIGDFDKRKYLVIGDSLSSDIKGAVSYGIDCVHFDPKGNGSAEFAVNYSIQKLNELKNIL